MLTPTVGILERFKICERCGTLAWRNAERDDPKLTQADAIAFEKAYGNLIRRRLCVLCRTGRGTNENQK